MPLHLLGKKSWNVYNRDNIDRVRRDEADARAREEAAEQRMQEVDAARRIALLRGQVPPPLPAEEDGGREAASERSRPDGDGAPRKRRKLKGEDDTDAAIRHAREDAAAGEDAKGRLLELKHDDKGKDAPLTDHAGHLQLIPAPDEVAIRKAAKNEEVEAEKARKRKRDEDQYTMRFSNAAGFSQGMQKPWYAAEDDAADAKQNASTAVTVLSDVQEKDVWGNDDPRRREREHNRISTNDPFAAMQQAQRQLKQSAKDREVWQKERMAEIEELKKAEHRRRRREDKERRARRRGDDEGDKDSLDGFSLDAPSENIRRRERSDHDRRRKHRHHHRHRSRSYDRDRDRDRRSKDRE